MEQHLEGLDSAILTAKAPEASRGFQKAAGKKRKSHLSGAENSQTFELAQGRDRPKAWQEDVGSFIHLLPRASSF